MIVRVAEVSWAGGTCLCLAFNDGQGRLVDAELLLKGPVFEPLRDAERFSEIRLAPICRTVVWPNRADLAPEALCVLPALDVEMTS